MAERNLLSKRGKYQSKGGVLFKKDGDAFKVTKEEKSEALAKVDEKRNYYNKKISYIKQQIAANTISGYSLSERGLRSTKEDQDNSARWVNAQIYKTKPKKNQSKPIRPTFRKIDMNDLAERIANMSYQEDIYKEKIADYDNTKLTYQNKIKTSKNDVEKDLYKARLDEINARLNTNTVMLKSNRDKSAQLKKEFNLLLSDGDKAKIKRDGGEEEYFNKIKKGKKVATLNSSQELSNLELNDLLNEARRYYKLRQPEDKKSKKLRAKQDNSFKQLYDVIRNAKRKHQRTIFINRKEIQISTINPVYENHKLIGYSIDNEDFKKIASIRHKSIRLEVSVNKVTKVAIKTTKAKEVRGTKIEFIREGARFYTTTNIKLLFNKAEKETGQRILYINGYPFNENDFSAEGRLWFLSPNATNELNLNLDEDKVTVEYSFTFKATVFSESETILTNVQGGELDSVLMSFIADVQIGNQVGVKKAFIRVMTKQVLGIMAEAKLKTLTTQNVNIETNTIAVRFDSPLIQTMSNIDRRRLKELNNKPDLFLSKGEKKEKINLSKIGKTDIIITAEHATLIDYNGIEKLKTSARYVYLIFTEGEKGGVGGVWLVKGAFEGTEFEGLATVDSP